MKDSPSLCIVDANILIDLHGGGLLREFFSVSTNALFALVLARTLKATLLTGDRHLARVAALEGVPVHGTLWVLDEMVRLEVIAPPQAAQALERMLARGSRLPRAECQRRLQQWRT
jgi:predicted nucleic acid-binding protein